MEVAEWAKDHIELIKRIADLEELGFSVTLSQEDDLVAFTVRKRRF